MLFFAPNINFMTWLVVRMSQSMIPTVGIGITNAIGGSSTQIWRRVMRKVYIVVKSALSGDAENIAVFASEGEAEQSASKHRNEKENVKAWVEEVNFYE